MIVGIDFGARAAGTTVCCWIRDAKLEFARAKRGQDADVFLRGLLEDLEPSVVGIDAPLSLPMVFTKSPAKRGVSADYLYRKCDRALGAMSPLFLGGLTARAIKLSDELTIKRVKTIEVYPAAFIARVVPEQRENYRVLKRRFESRKAQQLVECIRRAVKAKSGIALPPFAQPPQDSHELDSFLALVSSVRFAKDVAIAQGHRSEGVIHI